MLSLCTACGTLWLGFAFNACEPPHVEHVADERAYTQPALAGQSWDVIDDQDVKAIWRRMHDTTGNASVVIFETQTLQSDQPQFDRLEVSIKSQDRVSVTRKDTSGNISCNYTGRIWVETDLESYSAFSEDPNPNNRPAFYRIITGTYSCDGTDGSGSWLAKINE